MLKQSIFNNKSIRLTIGWLSNWHAKYESHLKEINIKYCPQHHPANLLGKMNAMGTLFGTRYLCLQSKWPAIMEITDVT